MIEVHKIMKLRGVLMMWKFYGARQKHCCAVLLFISSFLAFLTTTNTVYASTITRYPAQLEGCVLGSVGLQWVRPTCTESVAAYYGQTYGATAACNPETITDAQAVICQVSGIDGWGNNYSFTATQWMFPIYTCSYGGLGGPDIRPYNCDIKTNKILNTKNLGNQSNCSSSKSPILAGNPIHTKTGNKYAAEPDYEGSLLVLTRHYNSQQNKLNRHIGLLWRHTYNKQLKISFNDTASFIFAEQQDGRTLLFTLQNDQWVSDEDIQDQLFELPDGNWQLITSDDDAETYNVNGKLLSITNRTGPDCVKTKLEI